MTHGYKKEMQERSNGYYFPPFIIEFLWSAQIWLRVKKNARKDCCLYV